MQDKSVAYPRTFHAMFNAFFCKDDVTLTGGVVRFYFGILFMESPVFDACDDLIPI